MAGRALWSPPGRDTAPGRVRSALGAFRSRSESDASRSPIIDKPVAPARSFLLAATACGLSGAVTGFFLGGSFSIGVTLLFALGAGIGLGLWIGRVIATQPVDDQSDPPQE